MTYLDQVGDESSNNSIAYLDQGYDHSYSSNQVFEGARIFPPAWTLQVHVQAKHGIIITNTGNLI
jgi:hypothetical protein